MTKTTAMIARDRAELATTDILGAFAAFLRLDVAQGDASPETVRSYHTQAGQFAAWCGDHGLDPAIANETDLERYRAHLVAEGYERGTIAVKLSVVRRFYQAATWQGPREWTGRKEQDR